MIITGNFSDSSQLSSNTSADVLVKAAIENTKYYLNKNGKMQTGWQKIGGKWYYMDKNGALQESKMDQRNLLCKSRWAVRSSDERPESFPSSR